MSFSFGRKLDPNVSPGVSLTRLRPVSLHVEGGTHGNNSFLALDSEVIGIGGGIRSSAEVFIRMVWVLKVAAHSYGGSVGVGI